MKNAMLPSYSDPKEWIKRLQEINDSQEFFEYGNIKLTKELIKDVNTKKIQGKVKGKSRQSEE